MEKVVKYERSVLIKNIQKILDLDESKVRQQYNYFNDYVLLALFIKETDEKEVSFDHVMRLKEFIHSELDRIKDNNTIYDDYNTYYLQHTDILNMSGEHRYTPVYFSLKEGVTTLEVAKRIVSCFDKTQLSIVLPPNVVSILTSLISSQEKTESKVFQYKNKSE